MKIALIGFGKMGREIDSVAREQGETIVRVFDSRHAVRSETLEGVDVCMDFSTPETVVSNIHAALEARKDIVIGTTGWDSHLPEIRDKVIDSGLLYSANFSLGMNLFFRIVSRAADLMKNMPEYDAFIHEMHHRQKKDSPSGTALRLARIMGKNDMPISATRVGFVTGIHTVGFDSEADMIELKHTAKNRRGFALGALKAARWLRGRKGVYTMDDVEL
ncbi:MAG: 4-hydroxy-tetrahydrodipicolinate reductase [Acidobacteria bacterium]|nr:4-hydroxy-tetrahydrodipicolinate reductase [Acidobacteriota bacterium]